MEWSLRLVYWGVTCRVWKTRGGEWLLTRDYTRAILTLGQIGGWDVDFVVGEETCVTEIDTEVSKYD